MTDKDQFEREAEKILRDVWYGHADVVLRGDAPERVTLIAQVLRKTAEEFGDTAWKLGHGFGVKEGFEAAKAMAANVADSQMPDTYPADKISGCKGRIAELILALQPSEKTGG